MRSCAHSDICGEALSLHPYVAGSPISPRRAGIRHTCGTAATARAPRRSGKILRSGETDFTYPIDCAILLCLAAAAWPASAPTAGRAQFIRRITPWPVEPPLQIWRCPMHASFQPGPEGLPAYRFYEIAIRQNAPLQSFPVEMNASAILPQLRASEVTEAVPAVLHQREVALSPREAMLQLA